MNLSKDLLKDWLPPAMLRWARDIRPGSIQFEGPFDTWKHAQARCSGYGDSAILDKVLTSTLKVKRGEAMFERDSVLFDTIEYSWLVLAGLMHVAARNHGQLNILDFGGSLGSSYFQNRKFLKDLTEVRWNVVEQPHFVEVGRKYLQDNQLRFYLTLEECFAETEPQVILLSSVLQYLRQPQRTLEHLLEFKVNNLIIDRTCFEKKSYHEVLRIQHVHEPIYQASYPCWFLKEDQLLKFVEEKGYKLLESFEALDRFISTAVWKGYLFKLVQDGV